MPPIMQATGVNSTTARRNSGASGWLRLPLALALVFAASFPATSRAELQFDVFLGYESVVREAAWFPVTCEINNDGPSFNAVFELSVANLGRDQVKRVPLELPTNTRKRFVIPVFAAGAGNVQWDARLLDARGKVVAERPGLQPRIVPWEGFFLGALPRTFAGVPVLTDPRENRQDLKEHVARLQVEQFPDNPIALEGLDAVYLNSEKALGLKVNQVTALLTWIQEGGRLVVTVEQLSEVNSTPWLQQLLPCEFTDMVNITVDQDILRWLRTNPDTKPLSVAPPRSPERPGRRDRTAKRPAAPVVNPSELLAIEANFEEAEVPVATGRLRDGQVILAADNHPLIIHANRGRGEVIVLTFSPEREPFRSWKQRHLFWTKLLSVPARSPEYVAWGGMSLDGVFGALIDSRQVRKLPVEWLLLLLLVYLVVIGPFDQYWLKKINRQMLTWITFPTYVVLFSLLIYFIGYKLRAGETEWNELQVVDVLPHGQNTGLRGRTFASIYSSANANYQLAFTPSSPDAADQSYACLRGELQDWGRQENRANVEHRGNSFRADIFVPVWTSLLYVNDWFQPGSAPFTATLTNRAGILELSVENLLSRPLTEARVAVHGAIYELGNLPAGEKKVFKLEPGTGVALQSWVLQHGTSFQGAVQSRRSAVGSGGQLENQPLTAMVVSFFSHLPSAGNQRGFIAPPGLEISALVERGDAVVLAWDANQSYTTPVNLFKPPRLQRNALLRLALPVPSQPTL